MPVDKKYANDVAITDEYEALSILQKQWGDRTVRRLLARRNDEPHIEVAFYGSGYTREEYSSSEYYRVAPELVERLRRSAFVAGTPHWGYTDERDLRITESGSREYWRRRRQLEAEAARRILDLIAAWNGAADDFRRILTCALGAAGGGSDLRHRLLRDGDLTSPAIDSWVAGTGDPSREGQTKVLELLRDHFTALLP